MVRAVRATSALDGTPDAFHGLANLAAHLAGASLDATRSLVGHTFVVQSRIVGRAADALLDAPLDHSRLALDFIAIHKFSRSSTLEISNSLSSCTTPRASRSRAARPQSPHAARALRPACRTPRLHRAADS